VNVRVVGASHESLLEAIKAKRFRHDLYYRLAAARFEIPVLRDRLAELALSRHASSWPSGH
jgi:transcriptional regulator with PAS, ATPase and Fis domain